jgi:hypothetical protein
MFEPQQEEKASGKGMLVVVAVLVLAIAAGAVYYFMNAKGSAQATAPTSTATVNADCKPDPVKDLKIQRVTMDKDRNGTTAVWLVSIENRSKACTYSAVKYETSYIGAGNVVLSANNGTLATSMEPGEQKSSEIRDALYPTGTALYKFRVLDAKSNAK